MAFLSRLGGGSLMNVAAAGAALALMVAILAGVF
jgi:hypothetical protein